MYFTLQGIISWSDRSLSNRGIARIRLHHQDALIRQLPIGSIYWIFTYIYHKNQPNVGIPYMDGMGYTIDVWCRDVYGNHFVGSRHPLRHCVCVPFVPAQHSTRENRPARSSFEGLKSLWIARTHGRIICPYWILLDVITCYYNISKFGRIFWMIFEIAVWATSFQLLASKDQLSEPFHHLLGLYCCICFLM